jgi:putative DNA primase/helicase
VLRRLEKGKARVRSAGSRNHSFLGESMIKNNVTTSANKRNGNSGAATKSSGGRRQPKANSTSESKSSFLQTDAGNAELFAALYKDRLRYDHGQERWLAWEKHWWAEDQSDQVWQMAKGAARVRYTQATNIADEKDRKAEMSWARRSESKTALQAALALGKSERLLSTTGEEWDSDPWSLGVGNGVVDLRTGELRNGKQCDLITMHTEVGFDPAARCPRWLRFLDDVFSSDRELIGYVHRSVGYCVTGITTEQVIFVCHGSGANGKSTFLDVLRNVLGDYSFNLPFGTFEPKARSAIPNDIAALPRRRFVTALETNESAPLNEARIKLLTGCDAVSARLLYREFFSFTPTAKFWLATNHRPPVADDSPGFWRRIRLIPFLKQFDRERADKDLAAKLMEEAWGILTWVVNGCLLWKRDGLGLPATVATASEAYRKESDQLGEFLDEICEISADATVPAADLWQEYIEWISANHERPQERRVFSARLEARGFRKQRVGHDRMWTWFGLRIKGRKVLKRVPVAI